jgi:hypothetical protein
MKHNSFKVNVKKAYNNVNITAGLTLGNAKTDLFLVLKRFNVVKQKTSNALFISDNFALSFYPPPNSIEPYLVGRSGFRVSNNLLTNYYSIASFDPNNLKVRNNIVNF